MAAKLELGGTSVEVVLKDIKNVHLSVHPPTGRVRIAAPKRMKMDAIRLFAISKLEWIKKKQTKITEQERDTPREFLERESHFVWGRRYLLSVVEVDEPPVVELRHNRMELRIRPDANQFKRGEIIEEWYRVQVKNAAAELIAKWEPRIGVVVAGYYVRRMKTKWGSCNSRARTIRLNTDLAKKPREYLEYVTVHEMIHILEPTHGERFKSLMKRLIPDWEQRRQLLNRLPVRHENWPY